MAVRYAPLMLRDSARTWLNNLPVRSVNSWLDFEEVFIRNFGSTYQRPGHPRHLASCVQKPGERDNEYLTRWSSLPNTCEGVNDSQAIEFFTNDCRDDTLLKNKLLRADPQTMTELMSIADAYATAVGEELDGLALGDPLASVA